MRPILRPAEMAAADTATIESGTPGRVLMDRAGRAVARAAIELAGGRYGAYALVVCGKGNNGGDGFVVARELKRAGLGVTCWVTFDPSEARDDAAHHLERMRAVGVEPEPVDPTVDVGVFDVVVDAIFGTGFRGAAEGLPAEAIAAIAGHPNVIAVDIPSGVDGETGAVEGPAVHARVTVAMGAEKTGTAVPPGAIYAGTVEVADIGIDVSIRHLRGDGEQAVGLAVDSFVEMLEVEDVAASLPARSPSSHKRSVGSVAILAGSDEMRGAALLTVEGAMRMGAGYVTLGSTTAIKHAAASSIPELLVEEVTEGSTLDGESLKRFGPTLERADAVAIGPGIGKGDGQRELVEAALGSIDVPLVLDADALNVLAADPAPLKQRSRPTVITPHPAELGRLLGVETTQVVADRLAAALECASRFPSVVVLVKGHRTVVSYGGGKVAVVVPVGGPELATAGTGDVLTGAIAALLAAGRPPVAAALVGAYVHGLAGSVAGQRMGPEGVIASDVARALPEAVELIRDVPLDRS